MNKAKKIYLDENGNMIKKAENWRIDEYPEKYTAVDVSLMPQKLNLTLTCLAWQNSGITFWFKGDDGRKYPMSWGNMCDYLENHPIPLGEFDIEYLQQGAVYSIGFADGGE